MSGERPQDRSKGLCIEIGAHRAAREGYKKGVCLPIDDPRISCRGAKLAFRKCRIQHLDCSPARLRKHPDISFMMHIIDILACLSDKFASLEHISCSKSQLQMLRKLKLLLKQMC